MKPTHYTIIALLILIAVLAFGMFYFKDRADKAQAESTRKDSVIREKSDSLRYERNSNGLLIAEKASAKVATKEMQDFYSKEIDEIKNQLDINTKNIKAFVKAEFQARGSGNATVTPVVVTNEDGTTEEMTDFEFKDQFLTFNSRILSGETSAPSQYTYTDTFTFTFHTKKKNWFAKEELYGSGYFMNPNAKVTKATNVLVDNYKDKRWGIGVAAGYGVFIHDDEVKVGPGVMVSVHRTLIKF